jgi:hypothetical protein
MDTDITVVTMLAFASKREEQFYLASIVFPTIAHGYNKFLRYKYRFGLSSIKLVNSSTNSFQGRLFLNTLRQFHVL